MPDGLDETGNQKFIPLTTPTFYCFAFLAAVAGLQSNIGIMRPGMPYKLFLDPLSNTIKLFSDWKSIQVVKLMQQSGLRPSEYEDKPQLLDAADLFAYAAARALSDKPARNKEVCTAIYRAAGGAKTDWWWNPGNGV